MKLYIESNSKTIKNRDSTLLHAGLLDYMASHLKIYCLILLQL
jgi:hypothetical protein